MKTPLVLHNLVHNKVRTLVAVAGVSFAIILVFMQLGFFASAETTATDTLLLRRGVCRDFAHVMVSLARASAIPARYVSCYAPGVEPQDLHAIAEVFLSDPATPGGGAWYLVDATGIADPAQTVQIGVGRDAADVSFISAFSPMDYGSHTVQVSVEA